jgi:uncharacterized membrane protein YkvA (DUF1232 family)
LLTAPDVNKALSVQVLVASRVSEPALAIGGGARHLSPQGGTMAKRPPDIEILGPDDAQKERRVRERFWPTVKRALRQVPFIEEVVAAYYAMLDPKTPLAARLTLIGALAYFVAPFDFVPDILLGFGFLDDASVLLAALGAVRGSIKDEHRAAAREALVDKVGETGDEKPA